MTHQTIHINKEAFNADRELCIFVERVYDKERNVALDRVMSRYMGDVDGEDLCCEREEVRALVFAPYEMRRIMGEEVEVFYETTMPKLDGLYSFVYDNVVEDVRMECGLVHYTNVRDEKGYIYEFYPLDERQLEGDGVFDVICEILDEDKRRDAEIDEEIRGRRGFRIPNDMDLECFRLELKRINPYAKYSRDNGEKDVNRIIRDFLGKGLTTKFIENIPVLRIVGKENVWSCKFYYKLVWETREGEKIAEKQITPYNLALYLTLLHKREGISLQDLDGHNQWVKIFYELTQKPGKRASKCQMASNDAEDITSKPSKLISKINGDIAIALGKKYEKVAPLYQISKDNNKMYFILLPKGYYKIENKWLDLQNDEYYSQMAKRIEESELL